MKTSSPPVNAAGRNFWPGRAMRMAAALLCVLGQAAVAAGQDGSASMYAENATDRTQLLAPRVRISAPVALATQLEAAYQLDVRSRASVNLANGQERYEKTNHHEFGAGLAHAFADQRVRARYRFTTEPGYTSHTVVLGFDQDLAQGAAVASAAPYVRWNEIGRSFDSSFSETNRMFGLRLGLKQFLDRYSVAQVVYEPQYASGDLANPYNIVGLGGFSVGSCAQAHFCVPEKLPRNRLEHAFLLALTRALGDTVSVGVRYRFYLSDLQTHRVGLDFEFTWPLSDAGSRLTTALFIGLHRYVYRSVGVQSQSSALDGTLWTQIAL